MDEAKRAVDRRLPELIWSEYNSCENRCSESYRVVSKSP
jgi:hypothetical protein